MSPIWDHLRFPVKARSLGQEPSASFSRHPPNLTVDYEDAFDQSAWIPCRRRRGMMGTLTAEQVETFHREGWLLVEQALTAADLDPVQAELEQIVEAAARRYRRTVTAPRSWVWTNSMSNQVPGPVIRLIRVGEQTE